MSDRIRTSVLFSVLALLAACGGGGGGAAMCTNGAASPQNCVGKTDPACPGAPLVAMCVGGEWSQCGCSAATGSMTPGQSMTPGTMTGAPGGTMTCGNNKAEGDELCDGTDLKGMTCAQVTGMAAASGMLKCNPRCAFDTIMCLSGSTGAASPTGGTGAGGTGARMMGMAGSGGAGR